MTAGKGHWKCSLLRIGGPAIVMTLTAAHPGYSTDVSHELQRITASGAWLPLHLALLPGFALYGLSMLAWPTAGGRWWRLRQGGVVLNLVFTAHSSASTASPDGCLPMRARRRPPGCERGSWTG